MQIMAPPRTALIALSAWLVASFFLARDMSHAAGDAKAGRQKALQCQTCHGLDGLSKLPEAPNLSGQVEQYLVKALTDYKSGARKNEMMSLITEPLTERDIIDLAGYYSSIEITVQKPK
jgi:cytochrome c553